MKLALRDRILVRDSQRGMDEGKREMSRVTWGASGHVYQQILI